MGGVRCAKEIIDNFNRMTAAVACMATTIQLNQDNQPTQDEADEFQKAAREVAMVAAKIEKRVGTGTGY